jgi:hypothetical protein
MVFPGVCQPTAGWFSRITTLGGRQPTARQTRKLSLEDIK